MPIKKQIVKKTKKTAPVRAKAVEPKKQKMVSFGRAIANFFKKYFMFNGTATRAEYWWMFLFMGICVISLVVITSIVVAGVTQPVNPDQEVSMGIKVAVLLPVVLFYLATIIPWYALMARRLHDIGFTAKLLWISVIFSVYAVFVPTFVRGFVVMGWLNWMWTIILLILFLFPSKTKNNPYRK